MGAGFSSMIFFAALIPSISRSPTAIRTISGAVLMESSNAFAPFASSPATSNPLLFKALIRKVLEGRWSSITNALRFMPSLHLFSRLVLDQSPLDKFGEKPFTVVFKSLRVGVGVGLYFIRRDVGNLRQLLPIEIHPAFNHRWRHL